MKDVIQEIYDALDVAAKDYPIKALAPEIYTDKGGAKAESTLRGELNGQPGHKLGLTTALMILKKTGNLKGLDLIEAWFGRTAFPVPDPDPENVGEVMLQVSRLTKEFGEHMQCVGEALDDGRIDRGEARKCLAELDDLIRESIRLKAHLKAIEGTGRKSGGR